MAKVKGMAATKYIGKLGPQIFYMRDGQNVVREKAAQVSNPQSNAQMNQRIKFGNLIALYRLNKAWMEKYAFPLRPATQSVYNAFMSANLSSTEAVLTKEMFQSGIVVLEPIDFTKGNLPKQILEYDNDVSFVTGIKLDQPLGGYTTIADVSQGILDNNSWLRDGDQLSIVFNTTDGQNYGKVWVAELTLDLADSTRVDDSSARDFFSVAGSDDEDYLRFSFDILDIVTGSEVVGAVFIVSRKTSSGFEVTTSRMELDTYEVLNTFNTERARVAARRSYGADGLNPFLVPGYSKTIPAPTRIISVNGQEPDASAFLDLDPAGPLDIEFNDVPQMGWIIYVSYVGGNTGERSDENFRVDSGYTISGNTLTIPASVLATKNIRVPATIYEMFAADENDVDVCEAVNWKKDEVD